MRSHIRQFPHPCLGWQGRTVSFRLQQEPSLTGLFNPSQSSAKWPLRPNLQVQDNQGTKDAVTGPGGRATTLTRLRSQMLPGRSTWRWPGTSCSKAEGTKALKLSRGTRENPNAQLRPHPPGSSWPARGWTGASHRKWPRGCGPRCCSHPPQGEEEGLLPFWENSRPGRGTTGRQQVHQTLLPVPASTQGPPDKGSAPLGRFGSWPFQRGRVQPL